MIRKNKQEKSKKRTYEKPNVVIEVCSTRCCLNYGLIRPEWEINIILSTAFIIKYSLEFICVYFNQVIECASTE